MNKSKQITFAFVSAVIVLVLLKLAGSRFSRPPEGSVPTVEIYAPTNGVINTDLVAIPVAETNGWTIYANTPTWTNTDGATLGPKMQTVRMDLQTERFRAMKTTMSNSLARLDIRPDDQVIRRLVGARIKANWDDLPESFKTDWWAKLERQKLERAIERTLQMTNDAATKAVIDAPIGIRNPPVVEEK